MKIAILSRRPQLYSTRRLAEAAIQRGHEVAILDPLSCYMNITDIQPAIYYKGELLPSFDAVIPRIGAKTSFYGTAVVRQFEMMRTFCVNSSLAITRARDKLRCSQLLVRKGIAMPRTGFANSLEHISDLIDIIGGPPLVIKLIEGMQGVGVVMAETKAAAESVTQAFLGLKANMVVQEYIAEASGADIRCLVVGNKVVASMKRQAQAGEFRSNLHRGGTGEKIKISTEEKNIAVQSAEVMGLNVAGVDLLRSERGPLVLEVNSSPGLEGIETVTGKDVADLIIQYIEKTAQPMGLNTRYEG